MGTILSLSIPKNEVTANDALIIPNDAIRLRILANSDSKSDQALKRLVRDEVNKSITLWVSDLTSKEQARKVLNSKLPEIQKIAQQTVRKQNSKQDVQVEFGKVEFPTKLYGQYLYPAGQYEAILITLGEGTGANWWCVLFPPLCFLDFSNGVAVSEGIDEEKKAEEQGQKDQLESVNKGTKKEVADIKKEPSPVYTESDEEAVEVKFFIKEIWDKIFG